MVSAEVGNDTLICEDNMIFITHGNAQNYNSLLWTSNGDGLFLISNSLQAKYFRGNNDIENGLVTLTLHAYGYEAGSEATDSMIVFINQQPYADAGEDATIWEGESYTLQGEVEFSDEYEWSSSGDGTFNDANLLNAIYTPGPNDITSGEVDLVLTAYPLQACQDDDADHMTLSIEVNTGMINQSRQELHLTLTPNPTRGIIIIKGEILQAEKLTLYLLDNQGKSLFTGIFPADETAFTRELDLSYMENGIYFLRIKSNLFEQTLKIIKQ